MRLRFVTTNRRQAIWAVGVLALVLRLAAFGLAENKQGDAPMRVLIAERMNAEPAAARDARTFCQFGPLPVEVMRPFLWLDSDARRGSRWPSLLAGLAVFPLFFALGRRMLGASSARDDVHAPSDADADNVMALAGLALAMSPLHLQASSTATSEALYLFLTVGAFERLAVALSTRRLRDFVVAGALSSFAAVTRFDAWIGLPVAAAGIWWWGGRDRRALGAMMVFGVAAAVLPVVYLFWSWRDSGDPFFFARYIARDHAQLAAAVADRLGPLLGRARQIGVWAASYAAVMTPALVIASVATLRAWRRQSATTRLILASALAPCALYLTKGMLFGDFEPLPRFAIAPGVVLLPTATRALWEWTRTTRTQGPDSRASRATLLVGAGGIVTAAIALGLAFLPPVVDDNRRIWGGPESIAPITRLDKDDRELAEFLRMHRRPEEAVFLDTWRFADITIAHAAGVPIGKVATLSIVRTPSATWTATRAVTQASWFAVHDESWGHQLAADWPSSELRFGHWRVVHWGDRYLHLQRILRPQPTRERMTP